MVTGRFVYSSSSDGYPEGKKIQIVTVLYGTQSMQGPQAVSPHPSPSSPSAFLISPSVSPKLVENGKGPLTVWRPLVVKPGTILDPWTAKLIPKPKMANLWTPRGVNHGVQVHNWCRGVRERQAKGKGGDLLRKQESGTPRNADQQEKEDAPGDQHGAVRPVARGDAMAVGYRHTHPHPPHSDTTLEWYLLQVHGPCLCAFLCIYVSMCLP